MRKNLDLMEESSDEKEGAYLWGFMLYQFMHSPEWEEKKEEIYPYIFNRCLPLIEEGGTE